MPQPRSPQTEAPGRVGSPPALLACLALLACSNQSFKVLDASIEATITDPADGTLLPAGQPRSLRGRVSGGGPRSSNPPLAVWLVNGEEACAPASVDSDGVAACTFAPPVGVFDLTLEAFDGRGGLATDSIRLEGVDEAEEDPAGPSAPTLQLTPDLAVTTDTLVVVASNALDGSPVTYRYSWTVDGVAHSGTEASVDPAHTARDQSWTVRVTPSAGGVDGRATEATVDIQNSPPGAPTVHLLPEAPTAGEDALQCGVLAEADDADGDPLTYRMEWTVDGAEWPDRADSGDLASGPTSTSWTDDTIPADALTAGEWTCTARASDGDLEGAQASASVQVAERLPNACPDGNCALEFDGVDDYVEVPHDSTLDVASTGLTVEAWLFYSTIDTDCMTAVRKGVSTSPTYAYWLHKNGGPADSLHWGSWPAFTCTSWSAVRAGQWVHYAGVWDPSAGEVRTYVDGVEFCSVSVTSGIQQNSEPLRIGIDWDWGCPMHGVIDEVRISRVPRYSGRFTPSTTHTVDADTMALYTFDAYTGSTLYDRSGNGNHGLIDGATWTTSNAP